MSLFEIISGAFLLVSGIFIILVTILQESKQQGMTSAIGGSANDSFYGKNTGRTREAKLQKLTKVMAIVFFVVALLVNIAPVIFKS